LAICRFHTDVSLRQLLPNFSAAPELLSFIQVTSQNKVVHSYHTRFPYTISTIQPSCKNVLTHYDSFFYTVRIGHGSRKGWQ